MKKTLPKRNLKREEIDRLARENPEGLIAGEHQRYFSDVEALARSLLTEPGPRGLVMLSGPSSSGKTTTARFLSARLREQGMDTHVVSLDDFYRGRQRAPVLEDGSYDYEALEALDLDQLQTCLRELIDRGRTRIPRFDFVTGRPSPERVELALEADSLVIFEGIHAINPLFEEHLPQERMAKIYVNTLTPIYDGGHKLLARRSIRLVRRILRDERFRDCSAANTLLMWPQVVRGESRYIFPYVDTVDYVIDTTHACEPCLFSGEIVPALTMAEATLPEGSAAREAAAALKEAMEAFVSLPVSLLPQRSLLREFIGD